MQNFDEIINSIKEFDTIIIHRHQRSDPDAFGSQLGLKAVIENSFPNKKVFAVGLNNPGLEWVGKMDEVPDSQYNDALVIVTDTADTPRIDDSRFNRGAKLIKIDHHPNLDAYGDISYVDDSASSTSELIIRLVNESKGELKLDTASARFLYIGIIGDTGRFMYATHPSTLNSAAELLEYKIDASAINREMSSITLAQARFAGRVQRELKVEDGVGFITISQTMTQSAELGNSGTEFVVGIPGNIEEVKVWAIFDEQKDFSDGERYRVRLRSKNIPIQEIAINHRGGGHDFASGAKAKDENEIKEIINELKQVVKNA